MARILTQFKTKNRKPLVSKGVKRGFQERASGAFGASYGFTSAFGMAPAPKPKKKPKVRYVYVKRR